MKSERIKEEVLKMLCEKRGETYILNDPVIEAIDLAIVLTKKWQAEDIENERKLIVEESSKNPAQDLLINTGKILMLNKLKKNLEGELIK